MKLNTPSIMTYYERNKEKVLEYTRQYRQENQNKIKEQQQKQNLQKTECKCGSVYRRKDRLKHERTKKHQNFISSNEEPKLSYYQKNKEKQKEYRLYKWYMKNHTIPLEISNKYKVYTPLYYKLNNILGEIQIKCPSMLDDINIYKTH